MSDSVHFLAIDIGAGQGTRAGLFDGHFRQLDEEVLGLENYGPEYSGYLSRLEESIAKLLERHPSESSSLRGAGIASAGIMNRDGSFLLAANLPLLIGQNLCRDLEVHLGIPVGIANDADAGGLAEWSALRVELLYWVFGGGWGGAWVSRDGQIRHPSTGWDGRDDHLHYSNEPGYAIPLDKTMLRTLMAEFGVPIERWEKVMRNDFGADSRILLGPGGSQDSLRSETILSGPGRCRLFRAVANGDESWLSCLSPQERQQMNDPSIAGKHISKLSSLRVQVALDTDRLFGRILASATLTLLRQAKLDGLPDGVPIALGGKPSQALPWFGPACQLELGKLGISNYLRPSVIAERGGNANLLGAAVLASQLAN